MIPVVNEDNLELVRRQDNLLRYLALPEPINPLWKLNHKRQDKLRGVSIEHYTLMSQVWPKTGDMNNSIKPWLHHLIIYRPSLIHTTQALLFVNGGTRHIRHDRDNSLPHQMDFAKLADESYSIVVDLQDVPNQYLIFEDALPRKEDDMFAYAWHRYLEDNSENSYWPLSLPMTKAVIKAMDAVQQILMQESLIEIKHFVVTGLSKRGLATWLAALHDERINAIIPIVIDMLNTEQIMNHIYTSYSNNWPPAFYDFIQEKIPDYLHSQAFMRLMMIEDPLSYLKNDIHHIYRKRLSISKYIISASGDDFFTPDCINLYFDQLPGKTQIRLTPNQGHLIDMKIVEDAILAYYCALINKISLPTIQWKLDQNGAIYYVATDQHPTMVKLWEAVNTEQRDFRLAAEIYYSAKNLSGSHHDNLFQYSFDVVLPPKGWKAHFVEMTFEGYQSQPLVFTTPAYVFEHRS